ncbi:LOW QUALITY PROTEIN: hypothetical protein RJ639_002870 [Escallonia herrerae]|uniref:Uncharacterized protein n=1 Tax=Escallonia herrerae TaxID=1293975 RepID=A0AA89AW46_9ASTE|nr:LOW QUALITY PROTEIN: hypothetical protein RJ639_002870 [Escallonia herrerae]
MTQIGVTLPRHSPTSHGYPLSTILECELHKYRSSLLSVRLYKLGARKVVTFEVGPIGCVISIARQNKHNGRCVEEINQPANVFNKQLATMLTNLTSTLQDSAFILGHANWLGYDAIRSPSSYGDLHFTFTLLESFAPKKTRVIPPDHSPQIVEKVSVEEDPIFRPRWTLHSDDVGMPDSQISKQHLVHGMYASGSEMLSRFEMARQVLAHIETLEKRLERAKRRAAEEVKKARDQGIRDFLDGNAGDEWLKKCADDDLEIYELGFAKAKEMFAERFPDIPLEPPSGETILPSEAGDAAASHPPGDGPSGDAPEP